MLLLYLAELPQFNVTVNSNSNHMTVIQLQQSQILALLHFHYLTWKSYSKIQTTPNDVIADSRIQPENVTVQTQSRKMRLSSGLRLNCVCVIGVDKSVVITNAVGHEGNWSSVVCGCKTNIAIDGKR